MSDVDLLDAPEPFTPIASPGPVPGDPADNFWPFWHDGTNNWRQADCNWLRNRVVHIFADSAARGAPSSAAFPGIDPGELAAGHVALSFLTTTHSLEQWNGTTWETVRPPGLSTTMFGSSVILASVAAPGIGLTLNNLGAGSILGLTSTVGASVVTLDAAGVTIKTGGSAISAILATTPTRLSITAPTKLNGLLEVTGVLTAQSGLSVTGSIAASTSISAGGGIIGSSDIWSATQFLVAQGSACPAYMKVTSGSAAFGAMTSGGAGYGPGVLLISPAGAVALQGSSVSIVPPTTFSGVVSMPSSTASPSVLTAAGATSVPIAGIHVDTTRGPTGADVYPDGTIWLWVT